MVGDTVVSPSGKGDAPGSSNSLLEVKVSGAETGGAINTSALASDVVRR